MSHGTKTVKTATDEQKIEIQYEFAKAIRKMPFLAAQKILANKKQTRDFIQKICKDLSIPLLSEHILTQIPLLEAYYKDVYEIILDLSEIIFPDNLAFPAIMVDNLLQDEDRIMDCIKKFFNKSDAPVNLYKYMDLIAPHINREVEAKQIRKLQSGLVVFAHTGQDEPDSNHRMESYTSATEKDMAFMKFREYLRATGFHKYLKGYFMDRKGCTYTSSLWIGGFLVNGSWNESGAQLCTFGGHVDSVDPNCGLRELFLSLPF